MEIITPEILNTIIIGLVVVVGSVLLLRSPIFQQYITKKHMKLTDNYVKDLEDEIDYLKKEVRSAKLAKNAMERGPSIEGDPSELDTLLPDLVAQFEPFAPRWLKPLLGNKDTQKWIIEYVQKNPQVLQKHISKMIKKKGENGSNQTPEEVMSV